MGGGRIRSKLISVGPLIAVVALVISLGGASYAAIKIPPRSIGSKQLKASAVGARVLAVPNGAAAATVEPLGSLVEGGTCVSGDPPKCGPPTQNDRLRLKVKANRGGLLQIEGMVTLRGELVLGAEHGSAVVEAGIVVDGKQIPGRWGTTVIDDHVSVMPFQTSTRIGPGRHDIALYTSGVGFDYVNVEGLSGSISATLNRDIGIASSN